MLQNWKHRFAWGQGYCTMSYIWDVWTFSYSWNHALFCAVSPNISAPEDGQEFLVNVTEDITITCTSSAVPPPTIQFFHKGILLDRTDGADGIGQGIPMRVQVGNHTSTMMIGDATYEVSRSLTLFDARDEPLMGFECRAMNNITELALTPSDTSSFDILVQGWLVVQYFCCLVGHWVQQLLYTPKFGSLFF